MAAGFGGWLYPDAASGQSSEGDEYQDPFEREWSLAAYRVSDAATDLEEPRLFEVVDIFNDEARRGDGLPDQELSHAKKFVQLFRQEQAPLNKGVIPLDFVRECVRRSFPVAEVVTFAAGSERMRWVTDEQIEHIAQKLVALGFIPEEQAN